MNACYGSWKFATVVLHLYLWGFAGCFGWVNSTLNTLQILNGDASSTFSQQQHKQIALLHLHADSCATIPIRHEVAVEFQWPRLSPSVNLNMKNSLINHVIKSYTEIGVWNLQYWGPTCNLLPLKPKNYTSCAPYTPTLSFAFPTLVDFTEDLWASFYINQRRFSVSNESAFIMLCFYCWANHCCFGNYLKKSWDAQKPAYIHNWISWFNKRYCIFLTTSSFWYPSVVSIIAELCWEMASAAGKLSMVY